MKLLHTTSIVADILAAAWKHTYTYVHMLHKHIQMYFGWSGKC